MSFYLWVVRDHQELERALVAEVRARLGAGLQYGAMLKISPTWTPAEVIRKGPPLPPLRSVALACAAAKKCSASWRVDFLAAN